MSIGFFGLITLILLVLKLTGVLAIGWGMVIFPVFIPLIFWVMILFITYFSAFSIQLFKSLGDKSSK